MDIGRRAFMRGRFSRVVPHRPPWAADETIFTQTCTRCGACVASCPTGLLAEGAGGFPEADFSRGHCTFCADCADACVKNSRQNTSPKSPALAPALVFSSELPPWELQAVIATACLPHHDVLCRSCEDHCEAGAIRFTAHPGRPAQPKITQSRCTGCGECVASCPANAISMKTFAHPRSTAFQERSPQ